jgi:formylglycine-generating enzyme required for sulfatase activity
MVMIPGGDFLLGRTIEVGEWIRLGQSGAPEGYWSLPNPAARLPVQRFCIDVFEYPNRRGQMPRTSVGWEEARRLCQASGKRLPSRIEWQAAAQGREGRLYSYGSVFESGRCNTDAQTGDFSALAPAGSFPRCQTDLGVFDLDGNVSEWVEDDWEGPWYANHIWEAPEDGPKTMMGGTAWKGDVYGQDATSRHRHPPAQLWLDDGFRCAKSLGSL